MGRVVRGIFSLTGTHLDIDFSLGTIENCDHWALRGGSGISTEIKSKKTVASTTSGVSESTTANASTTNPSYLPFGWQDVNQAVGKHIDMADMARSAGDFIQPITSAVQFGGSEKQSTSAASNKTGARTLTTNNSKDTPSALSNVTSWIVKRIPLSGIGNKSIRSNINPAFPFDEVFTPAPGAASMISSTKEDSRSPPPKYSASDTARLLFGAGKSSNRSRSSPSAAASTAEAIKQAKFNHEMFYVALCRKLYDEGL